MPRDFGTPNYQRAIYEQGFSPSVSADLIQEKRRILLLSRATQYSVTAFKNGNHIPVFLDRAGRWGGVVLMPDAEGDWATVMCSSEPVGGNWRDLMLAMLTYLDNKGEPPYIDERWLDKK